MTPPSSVTERRYFAHVNAGNQTLLVANRGEIAVRIFGTAKRMGMRTVAVYSDADEHAPYVRAAEASLHIGPPPASESYLNRDRVVEAARQAGATLVHPGYGFLAEDDRFAAACEAADLIFVGPPSDVLRRVGDKAAARVLAERTGVPVLAGYAGEDVSDEALAEAASKIGYPVLVKPAAGGGGKGMHVVTTADELRPALESARRIARAAFDDDRLILERYIDGPRHVEVQVFADAHGSVVHLGERDCSLQRRHQKVMEETPAPNLDDKLRSDLHGAAVAFARAAGYRGAGTCEFLVAPDGTFGFIEMNARLQVEHPVTEAVTGVDLVEWQLRVALDEPLPDVPPPSGHAFEMRVYAEDPDVGFLPQTGQIAHVRWPEDVRVDAGIDEGTNVTAFYDPLLAKVVVHAPSREVALQHLRDTLGSTCILGLRTNLSLLYALAADDRVRAGSVTTDYFEHAYDGWRSPAALEPSALAVVAAAEVDRRRARTNDDPWTSLGAWRGNDSWSTRVVLRPATLAVGEEIVLTVHGRGPYVVDGVHVEARAAHHEWSIGGRVEQAAFADDRWFVWSNGAAAEIAVGPAERRLAAVAAHLDAPLPGQVLAVKVASGDEVTKGAELVVIEAMKMEHAIKAPANGTVGAVLCAPGDQVARGQALVTFEPGNP